MNTYQCSISFVFFHLLILNMAAADIKPSRSEVITPVHNATFNQNGRAKVRKQGGNPRKISGFLAFDGSMDGNRQVDPQIAVGGGYVFHATNGGFIIYDKKGNYVEGVKPSVFNGGIDPKVFFDPHNRVFGFDIWNPWDKAQKKPVNISVSETSDPTRAWNTYPVPAPGGRDGGGIGYSRKWIGYEFPGGPEQNFVLKTEEAMSGKPATVWHFPGNMGHPVATQDAIDDLYFLKITHMNFIITRVRDRGDGSPIATVVATKLHRLHYFSHPPKSSQKGTKQRVSSGDRRPKNIVLQNGHIWFSHTIRCDHRAAVQWHQLKLDGTIVQTGLIRHPVNNYIQTSIAVNKNNDVLIGFQETGSHMFISPRMAFRRANDMPGTIRKIIRLGEGKGAAGGTAWGDYSGSAIDGDNLLDLWTVQSIADSKGRGDTIIAQVSFSKFPAKKKNIPAAKER